MAHQWDPDVDLSETAARDLIELQHNSAAPAELRLIGRGWDNDAYLVNGEWVFRFPRRAIAAPLIEMENAVLPRIKDQLPLAIPNPVFVGTPDLGYPYPFSGYRLIPGTIACEADPDDGARHRAAPAIGTFLHNLHHTVLGADVVELVPPDLIGRADLAGRLGFLRERLDRLAALGAGVDFAAIGDLAERLSAAPPFPGVPRLVHGDLYSCHLLVDEHGDVTGVIDWGDLHWGDPALDLSIAFSYLPAGSRGPLFDAYGDLTDADLDRARFRALHYGTLLWVYGLDVGSDAVVTAGRQALERAIT